MSYIIIPDNIYDRLGL